VDTKVGFSDRKTSKDKFKKALKSLATKYRTSLNYLLPSDIYMDYQDLFNDPKNNKTSDDNRTSVYGKPIIEVPLMKVDNPVKNNTASTTAKGKSEA